MPTARRKGNERQWEMSAIPPGHDPSCVAPRRNALRAAAVTVTGAAITVALAGTALPATAAQTSGSCAVLTPIDSVTCVYGNPAVADYALRVPAGVTEVHIEARGGGGGGGGGLHSGRAVFGGGPGGLVSADFPVAAGDVLRILVGGRGVDANGMKPGAGGLNGGGKGGTGALGGGGGGGASTAWLTGHLNARDHDPRILMAGGGGGAGGAIPSAAGSSARGGSGGGEQGGNGGGDALGKGGIGATGPSGGAGLRRLTGLDGHSGSDAPYGGEGGAGGYGASDPLKFKKDGTWATYPVGAGGGGGGWGGGGGGAAGPMVGGGGGGGSGFVATSALAPSVARLGSAQLSRGGSERVDDGRVIITYRLPTDRHGQSEATVVPVRSAPATSDERDHS